MGLETKTCEKCGWVYPITHPERSCRFCGTPFRKRFCTNCGIYTELFGATTVCRPCNSKLVVARTSPELNSAKSARCSAKKLKIREDAFASWLKLITKVPKPLKTLTQEEWLAACLHFGECAVCRNDSIDARAFFVPFAFGGRYAAWNVIPVCDKCATALRRRTNPFIRYAAATPAITAYLQPILERTVLNETNL